MDELRVTFEAAKLLQFEKFMSSYSLQTVLDTNINRYEYLGSSINRSCRFCGKSRPEVSFKKEAHVIPQSIGNRYLLSYFECDSCNHFFGTTYDDSFANFFSDSRAMAAIKSQTTGKSIKHKESNTGFQIGHNGFNVQITYDGKHPEVFNLDLEKKELTLLITLPTHVPIFVFKAMMKIALCMIGEDERQQFANCFRWLLTCSKDGLFKDSDMLKMIVTSVPGQPLWTSPLAFLYTSKDLTSNRNHPQKIFILYFFNRFYQIMLPLNEKDKELVGRKSEHFILPALLDTTYTASVGFPYTFEMNMSSNEKLKGSQVKRTMTFQDLQ